MLISAFVLSSRRKAGRPPLGARGEERGADASDREDAVAGEGQVSSGGVCAAGGGGVRAIEEGEGGEIGGEGEEGHLADA